MARFKKVLIVYDAILTLDGARRTVGGLQTYLLSLAKVVESAGLEPVIVQEGTLAFDESLDGIRIIGRVIGSTSPARKYSLLLEAAQGEFDPHDTLVIWGSFYNVPAQETYVAIAIQHGVGFDLINASSRNALLQRLGLSWLIKAIQTRQAYRSFRRSKYRVCVDYNFLNWYRTSSSRSDDTDIRVIPNFTPIPEWKIEKRNRFRRVLFARRFVELRGVHLMLDVARNLLSMYPDVEFTFAGEGPGIAKIQELAQDYPQRVFITRYEPAGSLDFHKDYDIAVVPSIGSEGTSLSLLEAMAAGCAVVCTNVGGMTNIVIDRYNGLMVNPVVGELQGAISQLMDQPGLANQVRFAARSTVESGFSADLWSEKWIAMLDSVCGKP